MKNLIIPCITVILFGCNSINDPNTKYYANLTGVVSPYLEYTPQGEITKQEADSIGHYYAFTFKENRLAEVCFFKRNQPSMQSYFRAHRVKYAYKSGQLTRSYFDENGNKSIMWRHYYQGGDIHQEVFGLDSENRKSNLILKDSLGNQISSGDGVYEYFWKPLTSKRIIQTHVDSLGQPTVFRTDIPFERLLLEIDQRGYSSSVTRINTSDQPENHPTSGYATLKLYFDEFGNETGWSHLDDQMQKVNLPNEFGHAQWLYDKQYRNQKLGLLESFTERYYDKDGNNVQNEDSIHQVRYTINAAGDLSSLEYYNMLLEKQMHVSNGFFRAEVIYDSLGNRVSVHKYNINNELINS